MKTKWIQYFTPFLLVVYVCLLCLFCACLSIFNLFLSLNDSNWTTIAIIIYIAIGILAFSFDLFCKEIFKTQIGKIFLIESIVIGLIVFLFNQYF